MCIRDRIKVLWYECEDAAIKAVKTEEPQDVNGKLTFVFDRDKDVLLCTLPSGRSMTYHAPRVTPKKMPWKSRTGEAIWKDVLSFMTVDGPARKWARVDTYGGDLAQGATQAIARDIMADAMLRVDKFSY